MRVLRAAAVILVAIVLGIQFVPYRVDHPPVTQEVRWDDPAVAALVDRACADCHSNQTRVPWYGQIAPVAWYVNHHVQEAREHLNLSEMDRPQKDADEAAEVVTEGEMPPAYYIRLHPEADLSQAERRVLAAAFERQLGDGVESHHAARGHDD